MSPPDIRRVIVVVLDGLRPDAIDAFDLTHVRRLATHSASTMCGQTVTPSVTWPALTSLFTGVSPQCHGILGESLRLPRPKQPLDPLPAILKRAGLPSSAFMRQMPALYRGLAGTIARGLGFIEARFTGMSAPEILLAGSDALRTQRTGLLFFHWPDADRAGHAHGWMSPQYGDGAQRMDTAFGMLCGAVAIERDPHTLLIALADHGGGGGSSLKEHEDDHPLNRTIPLIVAGGAVRSGAIAGARLLDVPATVAWALGVPIPESYSGTPRSDIFEASNAAAA